MKNLIMKGAGLYLNTLARIAPGKAAHAGLNLFCHPFRAPLSTNQKAFLNTARQSVFSHGGVPIMEYRWGNGPKNILLVHGWQSHTYRWKRYVETFNKDEYTIHAFDAPGHGLSGGKFLSVPLYSEIMESVIEKIGEVESIISHSIGSFSAIYTIHRSQNLKVKKLVSLASPGDAGEFFDFYKHSLALSDRSSALIEDRFYELFKKRPQEFSAPLFAASLTIPGLIIHDEEDDNTPVVHSKKIHAAWAGSEFIATRGLGHNLRSDDVLRRVVDFVIAHKQATAEIG